MGIARGELWVQEATGIPYQVETINCPKCGPLDSCLVIVDAAKGQEQALAIIEGAVLRGEIRTACPKCGQRARFLVKVVARG